MKRDLVLCLGNEVLSDDRFGAVVAEELLKSERNGAEVMFAPVAGFALLNLLADRRRVLIVDTIQTGKSPPGTLHQFESGAFTPSTHLTTSHQISLPTALELGRKLGAEMPAQVDVLAVEAQDVTTLHEGLTPEVEKAVASAVSSVRDWIREGH